LVAVSAFVGQYFKF